MCPVEAVAGCEDLLLLDLRAPWGMSVNSSLQMGPHSPWRKVLVCCHAALKCLKTANSDPYCSLDQVSMPPTANQVLLRTVKPCGA